MPTMPTFHAYCLPQFLAILVVKKRRFHQNLHFNLKEKQENDLLQPQKERYKKTSQHSYEAFQNSHSKTYT
jgi:hypothetical protein